MNLRRNIKRWLYGAMPGFAGSFPYFGTKVFFPPNSMIFRRACREGIFEAPLLRLIQAFLQPQTTYLDVGANIGLMSVPILASRPDVQVVSFEPSPTNLPSLWKTAAASHFGSRWRIIPKAASDACGQREFFTCQATGGALDGFRNTGRAMAPSRVTVESTTIDRVWEGFGRPKVSCIKIDVEGGELGVLRGAEKCLASERAPILLEWNATNLVPYGCDPDALLQYALGHGLDLLSCTRFHAVTSKALLRLEMQSCENFLLLPR